MSGRLFVFIDESGDPGYDTSAGASSKYYSELALELTEDGLKNLISHIINWKYVLGKHYEYSSLPKIKQLNRYLQPIVEMHYRKELYCSCVYLLKDDFTGPYLKPSSYGGNNPLRFRNYIHRRLLEYHFMEYSISDGYDIELIFDQYTMTIEELRNLEDYLLANWNIPPISNLCHVNSLYTEPIQIASQLVNGVKDIILDTEDSATKELLAFIKLKKLN